MTLAQSAQTSSAPLGTQMAAAGPIVKRLIKAILEGKADAPPQKDWMVNEAGMLKPQYRGMNTAMSDRGRNPLVVYRGLTEPWEKREHNEFFTHDPEFAAHFMGDEPEFEIPSFLPAMLNTKKIHEASHKTLQESGFEDFQLPSYGSDTFKEMGAPADADVAIIRNMLDDESMPQDQIVARSSDNVMPLFGGSLNVDPALLDDRRMDWSILHGLDDEIRRGSVPFDTDWGLQ